MSPTSIAPMFRWRPGSRSDSQATADVRVGPADRVEHVVRAGGGVAAAGGQDRAAGRVETRAADVRRLRVLLRQGMRVALRRGSFLLLFLLVVALAGGQDTATPAQDLPGGAQLVAAGVWFLQGDVDKGEANTTVIEMPDYLIVVDGGYPGRAKELLQVLPKLSPKPVKYVFDTHAHGDHAYGNSVWTAAGAETMAFAAVSADMDRWEPGRWKTLEQTREDLQASGEQDVERPKKTIDGERLTLEGGNRIVEFLAPGWGHTDGDGYVWLPKDRVLVTGDAAVNGPYSYLADAWIEHWPRVLEAAIQLRPEVVLPGHGPAGGEEILVGQRRFLLDLYRAVEVQIAYRRTPRQMRIVLPPWDKPWTPANLLPDIEDTYAEIVERVPAGSIAHEAK